MHTYGESDAYWGGKEVEIQTDSVNALCEFMVYCDALWFRDDITVSYLLIKSALSMNIVYMQCYVILVYENSCQLLP